MATVTIELDDRQLQAWCEQTPKKLVKALRSAVDKSARYARNVTLPVIASDSGVPLARFRAAVPTVRGATAGNLSAIWIVGKSANSIRGVGGATLSVIRGQAVEASTFATTGGGSAHLTLKKAFAIKSGGGQVVFVRTGKGRSAIRAVYAEMPSTGMSQPDGAPRRTWEKAAGDSVALLIVGAVQAALDGSDDAPVPVKLSGKTS